jgi:hypothetical protein
MGESQMMIKNQLSISSEIHECLTAAAEWRLMSVLLERPRDGWQSNVQNLALEVNDPMLFAAAGFSQCATEERYLSLMGPGGAVSPREAAYAGFEDPARVFADLKAFYDAFCYDVCSEDPVDHISMETGFVGYLFLKEAYALTSDNMDAARLTRESREHFFQDHLARLARGMARKLGPGPAYLNATLEAVVTRMAHIPQIGAPQIDDTKEELECGHCG